MLNCDDKPCFSCSVSSKSFLPWESGWQCEWHPPTPGLHYICNQNNQNSQVKRPLTDTPIAGHPTQYMYIWKGNHDYSFKSNADGWIPLLMGQTSFLSTASFPKLPWNTHKTISTTRSKTNIPFLKESLPIDVVLPHGCGFPSEICTLLVIRSIRHT